MTLPSAAIPVKHKHPPGLPVLFFTEMWERFSFYCMLSILALYMNEVLGFSTAKVGQIYGLYIGLVYFSPVLGGIIADRWLGFRRSILIGAAFMGMGHFLLAFPPLLTFFSGLGCLIIGNGLFKPNISTLLGNLYRHMPEKRDDAFNIFYMGINLGAFASPLVAATLRNTLGWHYAFGAAGIGMIISGIIFIVFKRHYVAGDIHTDIIEDGAHVKHPVSKQQERKRLAALMLVFLVVIVFWMAFEQNGFTLNFWARDATDAANMPNVTLDRNYLQETGERRLAAELTQAINPFFVLLFTPLLVGFWNLLRRRRREPSTAAKIGIGMVITAGAYMILTSAGFIGGDFGRVHVGWLVSAYATITIAELCLSPMGLSLVSKLAPARIRGMMMGGWFAASAVGGILAGLIGGLWDHMLHSSFFLIMVVASLAAAAIFFFVIKFIRPIIAEAEQAALTSTQ